MKTIKIKSKTLILSAVLLLSISAYSQKTNKDKIIFVRVYNLNGERINKGHVVFTNDTILRLKKGEKFVNINIKNIGQIKTKRSVGNNVLTTSLIGGAAGAIIGLATSKEEIRTGSAIIIGEYEYTTGTSPATGALVGGGIGLAGGALIGLGGSLFKKSQTFSIDGDINKWKMYKQLLLK